VVDFLDFRTALGCRGRQVDLVVTGTERWLRDVQLDAQPT
jgi:hypothetical protein